MRESRFYPSNFASRLDVENSLSADPWNAPADPPLQPREGYELRRAWDPVLGVPRVFSVPVGTPASAKPRTSLYGTGPVPPAFRTATPTNTAQGAAQ